MDTNAEKLLLKDEVFQIVGSAIEVLNTLGHGLVEKPYKMRWSLSLVCDDSVAAVTFLRCALQGPPADHEKGLVLNYLRITNSRVRVILNFKRPKLEWERIVL